MIGRLAVAAAVGIAVALVVRHVRGPVWVKVPPPG
jgi:hypothetical protein